MLFLFPMMLLAIVMFCSQTRADVVRLGIIVAVELSLVGEMKRRVVVEVGLVTRAGLANHEATPGLVRHRYCVQTREPIGASPMAAEEGKRMFSGAFVARCLNGAGERQADGY